MDHLTFKYILISKSCVSIMTKRMYRIRQGDISHVKFNYKNFFPKTCIKKLSFFAIPLMVLHIPSGLVAQHKKRNWKYSMQWFSVLVVYWELVFGWILRRSMESWLNRIIRTFLEYPDDQELLRCKVYITTAEQMRIKKQKTVCPVVGVRNCSH